MEKVMDMFVVGQNTSITIEGNGKNIKQGEKLVDEKGIEHKILSVAMVEHKNPKNIMKSTTLLVDGIWNS